MSAVDSGAVRQIVPHYNFGLVVASVVVSLIGSFTSTQLICCARSARTFLQVLIWTILSSFVFGFCAVFCIHEIAMLACDLDVPVGIDPTWTIISATLATVFTLAALADGTVGEFYRDKERRLGHNAPEGLANMKMRTQDPDTEYGHQLQTHASAIDSLGANMNGGGEPAMSGLDDTLSETRSDAGLLDQDQDHSGSEATVHVTDVSKDQEPQEMSLAAFIRHELRLLLVTRTPRAGSAGQDIGAQMASAASRSSNASSTQFELRHLPRDKEANQSESGGLLWVTVTTIYAGLTVANIVKGFLWSLSLTSMHYCGLLSLRIPNGFVVFSPPLVILAATICWVVCIVGAICFENMTDLLAQQLLFSVVATSGCAALHWTGMWSATFLTSSKPSDARGYPIELPFIVASIAIVTCLAANFLLVHTATISRNKLAEIVLTRRELWRAIAQKDSAEAATVARSEFIASASHEIRTPLHHLQGYGDLLASRTDLSDEARDLLRSIQNATKTLSSITNNVLDWSRIENDRSEYNATTFDIRSACESVVNLLPHKDEGVDAEVLVVVSPAVPQKVHLDEGYLHRISMNLLSNAIKFTKSGYILLVLDLIENNLVITVKDTGHGMPAAFLPVMFEPFKQAQSRAMSRGTGLGLSIIKQLVHKMNGMIEVESQCEQEVGEGKSGTTFTVTIPLQQLASPMEEANADAAPDGSSQVAILEMTHNPRVVEGMQLAWERFRCQSTIIKSADFVRLVSASKSKWKYIVVDASVLEHNASLLTALQKNDCGNVLVPYSEHRDLHRLSTLPANLTRLRKPLEWHTFESQVAAAKDSSGRHRRKLRFGEEAGIIKVVNTTLAPKGGRQEYTVLLVEDNPVNQKLGQRMLTTLGFKVILAEDGEVAIEQLRQHDEVIDVVLMDQSMPRKDGVTATKEIRAMEAAGLFVRSPRTIIAVTAVVGPHAEAMCHDAGMNAFLTKPLSLAKLEAVMSALFPP